MKKLFVLLFLLISTSCFAKEYQVVRVFHNIDYNFKSWTFLYLDGEKIQRKTFFDYNGFYVVAKKSKIYRPDTIEICKNEVTWNVTILE